MSSPVQRIGVEPHVETQGLAVEAPALSVGRVDGEPAGGLTKYPNVKSLSPIVSSKLPVINMINHVCFIYFVLSFFHKSEST